jgi:ABC-type transport system involved in multi-copper enzyme maturation permease subunit
MIKQIWLKDIKGELYTWKSTVWLLIASLLFSFTSYLLLTNKELTLLDQTELLWLLSKVIIGVGLLMVTIDAASLITSEFEKETAENLFLAPISFKQFLAGKFFASLTLWFLIFIISIPYMVVTSAGSHLATSFIAYVFLLGTLSTTGFILLIFAISLFYRSSKNTLTTAFIILLASAIPALFATNLKNSSVISMVSKINPLDNVFSSLDNVLVDYQFQLTQNMKYLLPILIFCVVMFLFLLYAAKRFDTEGIIKNE